MRVGSQNGHWDTRKPGPRLYLSTALQKGQGAGHPQRVNDSETRSDWYTFLETLNADLTGRARSPLPLPHPGPWASCCPDQSQVQEGPWRSGLFGSGLEIKL